MSPDPTHNRRAACLPTAQSPGKVKSTQHNLHPQEIEYTALERQIDKMKGEITQ